jgi:hypothetical protein
MRSTLILGVLLLVVGCSRAGTMGQQRIGAAGGLVSLSDGSGADIPAGALTVDTTITATRVSGGSTPENVVAVGPMYVFGPEGTQFRQPVTLKLSFIAAQLPMGTSPPDIVVLTAPHGTTNFTTLAAMAVDATHVATTTMHFSDFVPVVMRPNGSDGGVAAGIDGAVSDAGYVDLAGAVDLASCLVTCNQSTATYDGSTPGQMGHCITTCSGTVYEAKCTQYQAANLGPCYCWTNSVPLTIGSSTVVATQPATATATYTVFKSTCGYPGTLPGA